MTPESFSKNSNVIRMVYMRTLSTLLLNRWLLTIVGSLTIILGVQTVNNYLVNEAVPNPNTIFLFVASLLVVIYTLRRIHQVTLINLSVAGDLAALHMFLELKSFEINDELKEDETFVEKYGQKLDSELKQKYKLG